MSQLNLKTREIGGVKVPNPGLGLMSLSHVYGKADDEESKQMLRHAIDIGCTFWDTADIYGAGHNEKVIGEVLKEGDNRSKVFLATKFANAMDPETDKPLGEIRGDAKYIRQAIEASIRRLGYTPDLYQQHRVDPKVSLEETYGTLEELRKEGKIKHIGVSECNANTLRKIAKICKLDALQIEYSPWTTDIETNGILEAARELKIPIIAYSPLGRGFLTGAVKSLSDLDSSDRRLQHPRFEEENIKANQRIVDTLQAIAAKKGITSAQLCIAWVAAQDPLIIPIPGTKSIKRLDENWASREVKFTEEELKEIRAAVDNFKTAGERYPPNLMAAVGH